MKKLPEYKRKWWSLSQKFMKGQIGMAHYKRESLKLRKKYLTKKRKKK